MGVRQPAPRKIRGPSASLGMTQGKHRNKRGTRKPQRPETESHQKFPPLSERGKEGTYLIELNPDLSAIEVIIWLSLTTLPTSITRTLSWSGSNLAPRRGLAAKSRSTNLR